MQVFVMLQTTALEFNSMGTDKGTRSLDLSSPLRP